MMIRKHIVFRGQVQGVGFRYRAGMGAHEAGCTGWARNEYDGSVSMEIQGTEQQIDSVIRTIAAGRFVHIESLDVTEIPVKEGEKGFGAY